MKANKDKRWMFRMTTREREEFAIAAATAGLTFPKWVRESLRIAAIVEAEAAGEPVPQFEEA
jgi:hypothetical protein